MLDGHAHQALGASHRNRFDTDAGIEADLLFTALQHVFVKEFDQALRIRCAFFPFDPDVNVLRVFAEDNDVHALGMLHGRRHAGVILHRAHAGVEIEDLAQGDVEGADAASDGRGQRTLDGDAKFADGADGVVGKPVLEARLGLFAGKNFVPGHGALSLVSLFDRGVEYADGGFPNIAPSAVAFNERDDRAIGDAVLAVAVFDLLPVGWDGDSVERRHYTCLQKAGKELFIIKNIEGSEREAPPSSHIVLEVTRLSPLPAFVLCDPRLHQFSHKIGRQRLVYGEADGAFGCLIVLEFVFRRCDYRETSREETAVL